MLPYVLIISIISLKGILSFQQHSLRRGLHITSQDYRRRPQILLKSTRGAVENIEPGHGYFNNPFSFESNALWMSDFSYESDRGEDALAYLPLNLLEISVGTELVLRQVTDAYIRSDLDEAQDEIKIADVLETINTEYKYTSVPVIIGNESLLLDRRTNSRQLHSKREASQIVSKILSFAAIHKVPAEIASHLFSNLSDPNFVQSLSSSDALKEIQTLLSTFEKDGWRSVEFPKGLSIRIKRDFASSTRRRQLRLRPWPRKSLLTRSRDINEAREALHKASQVKPPPKLQPKPKSIAEIDEFITQMNVKSELSQQQYLVKDLLTFFPRSREQLWSPAVKGNAQRMMQLIMKGKAQQVMRAATKHKSQILSAGRAWFVAYAMIAFCMYTFSMILKWRFSAIIEPQNLVFTEGNIIQTSVRKFSRLFSSTYFCKQAISKLHRIIISCIFAPFLGHRSLLMLQRRLKISANQAVGLVSSLLIGLSVWLWCYILITFIIFH